MTRHEPLITPAWVTVFVLAEALALVNVAFVAPDRQFVVGMGFMAVLVPVAVIYRRLGPAGDARPGAAEDVRPRRGEGAPVALLIVVTLAAGLLAEVVRHAVGAQSTDGSAFAVVVLAAFAGPVADRWWRRRPAQAASDVSPV